MNRREFLPLIAGLLAGAKLAHAAPDTDKPVVVGKLVLTDAEWKKRLTPEQYHVLRQSGTERAGTSRSIRPSNRTAICHCAMQQRCPVGVIDAATMSVPAVSPVSSG